MKYLEMSNKRFIFGENLKRKTMNTELKNHIEAYDKGKEVQSVEMGGISNGYEIAIQELAIETMRNLLDIEVPIDDEKFVHWVSIASNKAVSMLDKNHGFSGAQVGASKNISAIYWRKTPEGALDSLPDKERIMKIKKVNGNCVLDRKIGD